MSPFSAFIVAILASGQPGPSEPIVDVSWLLARRADPKLVVLHVARTRETYDSAHVPGARFVDLAAISVTRDGIGAELPEPSQLARVLSSAGVSNDSRVVIYGEVLPAARLWFTLDWAGMGDRAFVLDGGLEAWRAAGQPVSTDPPAVTSGNFVPRPVSERVVDASWVRAHLEDEQVTLIDARSTEEYRGEKAEEGIPRRGHIPGARNLDWTTTLVDGKFRPLGEIRRLFEGAGANPAKPVVTYCRTGTRSSVLHLLARALGYRARMYDGSMVEWSGRTDLPIEIP